MRPLYETAEDLSREQSVALALESAWDCRLVKMPIRYNLDFVITQDDKAVAFCEVKTRNYTMADIDRMGGYLMSIGKWSSAMTLSESSRLPFILTAATKDGIWYASFKPGQFQPDEVLVRGRKDRGDWQDIEPCVLLKVSKFRKLQ